MGTSGQGSVDQSEWWSNPQEVIRFARVLIDADQLGGCQHRVVAFFESPWDWGDEHQIWCDAGRPHDAGTGATFDALCSRFAREITDDHANEYVSPLRWLTWSVV